MPGGVSPTAERSSTLTPGSNTPLIVRPQKLDNPPRTRVMSTGGPPAPIQNKTNETFVGLSFVDLLNMRQALNNHLNTLSATDTLYIASTKRILDMVTEKIAPNAASAGVKNAPLIPSVQILTGAQPKAP